MLNSVAVILEAPEKLAVSEVPVSQPEDSDIVVDVAWSGISTGTERLLYTGQMPPFPGMGYPLVPGYESVGRVCQAGPQSGHAVGDYVFAPGARCFGEIRGLFGGAASRLVLPGARAIAIDANLGQHGVLLALAATAHHAIEGGADPDLIVGHGVLGRLLARLAVLGDGPAPVVWEKNPRRAGGAEGYEVISPDDDDRRDYRAIYDVSGDPSLLDPLISRLGPGGEVVLAGFYHEPLQFAFAPAFMREARIRIAAEWQPADMEAVAYLVAQGHLSLDGLITHCNDAPQAADAYRTAFEDPDCLKMVLDWSACQ